MNLHEAAATGDVDALRSLLIKKVKINAPQKQPCMFGESIVCVSNATPLLLAAGKGHEAAARLLLEAGADPDIAGSEGNNPLIVSAMLGDISMIRLLVEKGARLDLTTQLGDAAIHAAINFNHWETVRELLRVGASPNQPGAFGLTPLVRVSEFWKWAIQTPDPHNQAALSKVLNRTVEDLQAEEAAKARESLAMAKWLLDSGADVNQPGNIGGEFPLHIAAAAEDPELALLFLDRGAEVNSADRFGVTPLMTASKNPRMCEVLLHAGADPNRTDGAGRNALFHAAFGQNREAIKSLLAVGAKTDTPDFTGKTVLDWAAQEGDADLHRFLVDHGAQGESAEANQTLLDETLARACQVGNLNQVESLLRDGANPNYRPKDAVRPLLRAARGGHPAIIRTLLSAGAKVNKKGPYDQTALHEAAERGDSESVRLLIEAGAEMEGLSDLGHYPSDPLTPLMFAAKAGNAEAVRILIAAGAKIDSRSKGKQTALLIAAAYKNPEAVAVLRQHGARVSGVLENMFEHLEFPKRLKEKGFKELVSEIEDLCGVSSLKKPRLEGAVLFDLRKSCWAQPYRQGKSRLEAEWGDGNLPSKSFLEERAGNRAIHAFLAKHQSEFVKKGCYPLYFQNLHGDKLAVLPTANPYAAVACLGPAPKGLPVMLEFLDGLAKVAPWILRGSSYDTLMLQFTKPIADPELIAKKFFQLRSDERGVIVDGEDLLTDTIKALAAQLKGKRPVVRLWWD